MNSLSFESDITSPQALRGVYRPPAQPALQKQIDRLDSNCAAFIAKSPFVVVSTADDEGRCDASPRGGPPGFVKVLDDKRLGIPDLSGNNRLDSMENIVRRPGIALLFMIPGKDEMLRVNGNATVSTAADVLSACAFGAIHPKAVIGVEVEEAYIHCAKAIRRAALWDPAAWPDLTELPSVGQMLRDHCGLQGDAVVDAIERRLDENSAQTLWDAGGADPATTPN